MTDLLDKTGIIACYYNPSNSKVRYRNFIKFYKALRSAGIDPYIAELTFMDARSSLRGIVSRLFRVRAESVIWQKERVLNRLIALLPQRLKHVAWIDVDILLGKDPMAWLKLVSQALDDAAVVQGFATVDRLPRRRFGFAKGDLVEGFGYRRFKNGNKSIVSGNYHEHGHTGYVWAAHRDLLDRCGLYDCCLSGSGDHLMAHAFAGEFDSDCLNQVFRKNRSYRGHFGRWAQQVAHITGGHIGFVDAELKHLWHGSPDKRRYRQRDIELTDSLFDPDADLIKNDMGCWEWTLPGQRFNSWASTYFDARDEP